MKRYLILIIVLLLFSCYILSAKGNSENSIILATTSSAENSGLLPAIIPVFEDKYNITVKVIAVGSGKAMQIGMDGEADVLLVHSKSMEEAFMEEGYGIARSNVMYNDFVIVGPKNDPAQINTKEYAFDAFRCISESRVDFISRGDQSGTHVKELSIWENLNITKSNDWYKESGQGMGPTLEIASELEAYCLTDRGTFMSMMDNLELEILYSGDPMLFNQYSVIQVNPTLNRAVDFDGAKLFYNWIISEDVQRLIDDFGVEEHGEALFHSNAEAGD